MLSNSSGFSYDGQDFLHIRKKAYRRGYPGSVDAFNRLVKLEQAKAIARIPKEIKDKYEKGYPFFIGGISDEK
jgi:hypothetical protein